MYNNNDPRTAYASTVKADVALASYCFLVMSLQMKANVTGLFFMHRYMFHCDKGICCLSWKIQFYALC